LLRSVKRNSSEVIRGVGAWRPARPLYTPAGLYLGHFPWIPLDGERVEGIFRAIILGLYYHLRRVRIPDHYVFQMSQIEPLSMREFIAEGVLDMNGPYGLGDVFWFYSTCADSDPCFTYWVLAFYGGYFLWASTYPPGALDT
jgi:hypothetical protein